VALPTEPIGSLPRPPALLEAIRAHDTGHLDAARLEAAYDSAVKETITRLEALGSPVVVDGEQRKASFATYPLEGLQNMTSDGVTIPFADGHTRQLPRLARGPFRYGAFAARHLEKAKRHARQPLKQAVISASALSLLYPQGGVAGYSQETFTADLVQEAERDIRACFDAGAYKVQIDFTEARLSLKLDPSGGLLNRFVDLNNRVLERFSAPERSRIGVHTCPGGDEDSTHSADVGYAALLPSLLRLGVGSFYLQLASEKNRERVLSLLKPYDDGTRTFFVGVTDPIDARVETAEQVRDHLLLAARYIRPEHLGSTDDCGFAPFCDDVSTTRETAFAKIAARLEGTALAAKQLGL
jgi:5-methyltetrahydropteroyltriglutamate--homocysteine methyltransferase